MTTKRPSKRGPRRPAGTKHFSGSLVEELRGQVQVVVEAVAANGQQIAALDKKVDATASVLGDKLDGVATALNDKLDGVATALNDKIDRVGGATAGLSGRITRIEEQLTEVRVDLATIRQEGRDFAAVVTRKAEVAVVVALEQRVAVLERAAGGR